ncbi:hypothetical protein I2W78_27645 [Streptomyces spinoverrucosus]|uniref:hypothetical protein n=1 Tax=Streptomyces spinoverrucosus TaxID=284043 RepID=UPI0018C38F48|nr:hypothetical protein [Streptomyces spinoverrucosus]MBG0855515.1 hypothetical protein [Streptomyces spinoverrucosus]
MGAGVVGGAGTAVARDAAAPRDWQAVTAPECVPAAQLIDVAAAGPGLAWAVGEEGRDGSTRGTPLALVRSGGAWARVDLAHLGLTGALHSVAGTCAGSAWALGSGAHLLAWDGRTWQEADFPGRGQSGTTLTGVAVAPDGEVWCSGRTADGSVLMRDARHWLPPLPSGNTATPSGVHMAPDGQVWVYGPGIVARWNGTEWTELPAYTGIRLTLTGLLPVAHDDIWLTGYDYGVGGPPGKPPGTVLLHGDGTTWDTVTKPFTAGMLTGIVADEHGRPDRISGWDFWDQNRAHHLRWDGAAWVSERGAASSTPVVISSLVRVPDSADGYWAVGTTSTSPYPPAQVRIEQ